MPRKNFPKSVAESVLIKSRRHCCVCDQFCGTKIEIHHIGSPEDNSEDNAIPVCFNCHAEIAQYNLNHPTGRKYSESELKKLRDKTFLKYSESVQTVPESGTEYGRGFHEGTIWAEKSNAIKDIWRFISVHGDFAIEILIYFDESDFCTIMREELHDDDVLNEFLISQSEGFSSAWGSGQAIGLWGMDGNSEQLFLTKKGKIFRGLVRENYELRNRFEQLKEFWDNWPFREKVQKPLTRKIESPNLFNAGFMNWLQIEIDKFIKYKDTPTKIFILSKVTPREAFLIDIENGDKHSISEAEIEDIVYDTETGDLVIEKKSGIR